VALLWEIMAWGEAGESGSGAGAGGVRAWGCSSWGRGAGRGSAVVATPREEIGPSHFRIANGMSAVIRANDPIRFAMYDGIAERLESPDRERPLPPAPRRGDRKTFGFLV